MMVFSHIREELESWARPVQVGSHLVVPTFSLYPSNGVVQVFIEGGDATFVASDGGGALETILGAGGHSVRAMRFLKEAARRFGLSVDASGWIHSSPQPVELAVSTISNVAEASRSAAEAMVRHFQPQIHGNFRRELERYLDVSFRSRLERRVKIVGASNTPQTFDYLINAPNSERIVLDAVVPEPNSINSAIVSHVDLRNAKLKAVQQFIVYDGGHRWRSSDLALLRVGATPIEYGQLPRSLEQMAS